MIGDRRAERLEPPRDRHADASHADHADGAVAQRRPAQGIGALAPFAGAQIALGLRQLADRAQEQADRGVGDLLGEHVGRVGDDDAAARGRGDVDMVVADAEARDDVEVGQPGHERIVDRQHRRDGHRAHMAERGKTRLAVRAGEAMDGEGGQSFGDDRT